MLDFIRHRIYLLFIVLFASSVVVFLLLRCSQSNAVMSYLIANSIPPTDESIKYATHLLGFDKSLITQYFDWFLNFIRLDFGRSFITNEEIRPQLFYYYKNTAILGLVSLIEIIFFSVLFSCLYFVFKLKRFVSTITFIMICIPNFFLGILMIVIFSLKLKLLSPIYNGSISSLIMPSIAISSTMIGVNSKMIISNINNIKNEQFVLFARIIGISKIKIFFKYILANALIPIITCLSMQISEIISGAIIVESIFAYPGIGRFLVTSLMQNDYNAIQAFIMCSIFIFYIISFINDIIVAFLTPSNKKNL